MNDLSRKLGGYIVEAPKKPSLTNEEARLYRTLKTEAERFRACRNVTRLRFKMRERDDHPVFLALLEGRDAMSVCRQIARRFESMEGVSSRVVSTGSNGSRVVVKLEE